MVKERLTILRVEVDGLLSGLSVLEVVGEEPLGDNKDTRSLSLYRS
jgi:hypothetical protein